MLQRRTARPRAGAWPPPPRAIVLIAIAIATLGTAAANDEREAPRKDKESRTLSAKEVAKYFEPYAPEVRACYLANAKSKTATGRLRLELIIHPNGNIYRFGYSAPGVVKPWAAKLDACLKKLAPTWHFPDRESFTTAVIPFIFQRTKAPNAGPIESCWDPKGCPPGKEGKR